jgi:hypothetical protein
LKVTHLNDPEPVDGNFGETSPVEVIAASSFAAVSKPPNRITMQKIKQANFHPTTLTNLPACDFIGAILEEVVKEWGRSRRRKGLG